MSALRPYRPWLIAAGVAVVLAVLPLLAIPGLGILPGPTYTPGSLHLMSYVMVMVALALTYHLMFGTAGLLTFGHALSFAVGAYGLAMVLQYTDLPLLPAACVVLVAGVALTHLLGAISLRVSGISFAMVTLAFAEAGNVLTRRNPGRVTGGDEGLALRTTNIPADLVGVVNTRNLYWIALAVVVGVFVVVAWVEHTRAGHVIAATRENEVRVRVLGGRPYLVKLLTFVVAGTLAIVAGMAYLLLQSGATPHASSTTLTLSLLVMVVLGGVGKRWGAVVGAIVYTMLDARLVALSNSPAIAGLPAVLRVPLSEPMFLLGSLFIAFVIFLPGGIAGFADRFRGRARTADQRDVLEVAP
jgi:branched-chain amino acid transport system permease protein